MEAQLGLNLYTILTYWLAFNKCHKYMVYWIYTILESLSVIIWKYNKNDWSAVHIFLRNDQNTERSEGRGGGGASALIQSEKYDYDVVYSISGLFWYSLGLFEQ